jgi:hypothetical protein
MNAYELLMKFLNEVEKSFEQARQEGNFWKAAGLRKLYNCLKELKDSF